jgi:hypothetical protein
MIGVASTQAREKACHTMVGRSGTRETLFEQILKEFKKYSRSREQENQCKGNEHPAGSGLVDISSPARVETGDFSDLFAKHEHKDSRANQDDGKDDVHDGIIDNMIHGDSPQGCIGMTLCCL